MNVAAPKPRTIGVPPLHEAAMRLDLAAALLNNATPAVFATAQQQYCDAFHEFEIELSRATGIPAHEIAARLEGKEATPITPSYVVDLTAQPWWLPRPLICLETRVITISPAWVLIGCALIAAVPLFVALVLAATPA